MSSLIYNNIELSLIKTNSIDRTTHMSDDRTEYMWTTFTIDITCIYNPGATSYPTAGVLPMETDDLTRSLLMQPRQPLFFSEGGIAILNIPSNLPGGGAIDCENGPIPLACNITRIASARLFFVRYVIKASIIECPTGAIVSAVASSRYSRTESFDGQYRSTMTTAGKAMFRSNALVALGTNADAFRGYIIPDPMLGYKRGLLKAGIDSSGIEMEWMTVDVEQFVDLGDGTLPGTAGSFGISEMDLEYSTSTIRDGGAGVGVSGIIGTSATVEASAAGPRTADRLTMLTFLTRCAVNKLDGVITYGLPTQMSMRENVFKNSVSLVLTYWALPKTGTTLTNLVLGLKGFVGAPIASLPATGGVDIQPPFSNATRGMLAYQLAVNAFATACYSQITSIGGCDQSGTVPPDVGSYRGQCPANPQVYVYGLLNDPSANDKRRSGKQSFRGPNPEQTAYHLFSVKSEFTSDAGIIPMQVASNPIGTGESLTQVPIQVFQPYTKIAVDFAIERYGCDPEIPSSTATVTGFTLLKQSLSPMQVEVGPDGSTPIYRLVGRYSYMSSNPFLSDPVIPFPIPPWLDVSPSQFTQTAAADYININGAWNSLTA